MPKPKRNGSQTVKRLDIRFVSASLRFMNLPRVPFFCKSKKRQPSGSPPLRKLVLVLLRFLVLLRLGDGDCLSHVADLKAGKAPD